MNLFDPATGEVVDGDGDDGNVPPARPHATGDGCPDCARLAETNLLLQGDLNNAEKSLRDERRAVAALKRKLDDLREADPNMQSAKLVFAYWVDKTGRNKGAKFGEKRQEAVLKMLKLGYSVADLKRAIDGACLPGGAFVNDETGKRYDDLELICRDETKVDRFRAHAYRLDPRPDDPQGTV